MKKEKLTSKKKRYAVTLSGDRVTSVEVDGKRYASAGEIPDPSDADKMALIVSDLNDFGDSGVEMHLPAQAAGKEFPFEKLILGIFAGVAVLLLAVAAWSTYSAIREMGREVSAPGRVVDLIERVGDDEREWDPYYYPVVQFPVASGFIRTVEIPEGSRPSSYEIGDEVTVLYDPRDPEDARIQSFFSAVGHFILPAITGFLGIAFLGGVFFVKWVEKNS